MRLWRLSGRVDEGATLGWVLWLNELEKLVRLLGRLSPWVRWLKEGRCGR